MQICNTTEHSLLSRTPTNRQPGGPVDVHGVVRGDAAPRAFHVEDRGEDYRHRQDPGRAAEDQVKNRTQASKKMKM